MTLLEEGNCGVLGEIDIYGRVRGAQTREQERERERGQTKEQELNYASVTGVVHLDCNQGAPKYLYKNVVACM